MRVALPVWFDVVSIDEKVSTEEMSEKQIESAAARVVDQLVFQDCDGPTDEADNPITEGFVRGRVKILGIDPD